LANDRRTTAKE